MQIKILDSWLREYLSTSATAKDIAHVLSLTSISVDRLEKVGKDYLYDIEITSNRPDLMSVVNIASEAAIALKENGFSAEFKNKEIKYSKSSKPFPINIKNNNLLTSRILGVVLSVKLDKSTQIIRDRLEASDIRSLNNVVDVTNYIMREIGHPLHVFDFEKLSNEFIIREAKKAEKIITLDKKEYSLNGGEIVADNGAGEIIDLLGIMGTLNSVVDSKTKKILLFLDNNNKHRIRSTSMMHSIRTEAAVLNEKGVSPELGKIALTAAIELLEKIADAKVESEIIDIYPNKPKSKTIFVSLEKINSVIGISLTKQKVVEILKGLNFEVKEDLKGFKVIPPLTRSEEIEIPEDVIEEVARIYGYHKIPSIIPPFSETSPVNLSKSEFFWEEKVKNTLLYWGFNEVYTYSLVSAEMLEVDEKNAVKLENPLGTEFAFLRTTLIPSLLEVIRINKGFDEIKIFELANVYHKKLHELPEEILMLSGIIKKENNSFFEVKGLIEGLFHVLGIQKYDFKKRETNDGADIFIENILIGDIEVLDRNLIDFELNFSVTQRFASNKKAFKQISKFPPAVEDIRLIINPNIEFSKIKNAILESSKLIASVELLDIYEDKKTFRVKYQSNEKNLTASEISQIREKITNNLELKFGAKLA